MGVTINIVNRQHDETCSEYQAAVALKSMLDNSFDASTNGHINIAYSLTLCGQEVRDIDLLLFGKLDNYLLSNDYTNGPQYPKKDLKVDGFCIVIELKEHPSNRVVASDTHVHVEYNGTWKDATEQNEKQRYSFSSYISDTLGYNVYTTNLLWLKGLNQDQLSSLANHNKIGALPATFTFVDIIDGLIAQGLKPYYDRTEGCYHINPNKDENFVEDIEKNLFTERLPPRGLTRKKLETLLQDKVREQLTQTNIGQQLTIFKGRAGTGKTFRLIQSALQLANPDTGKRCLLLTYNHALVSDIRRLLHFMNIPDGIDNYTIQIQTLHSFFMQLMQTLNISTGKITYAGFNDKEYNKALDILLTWGNNLIEKKNIQTLKEHTELAIDWDYILIDEAQDWAPIEKDILFKVYGLNRIIVADGVDQFMRNNQHLQWVGRNQTATILEQKSGLRQKTNLTLFVNAIAAELGLKWNVQPSNEERLCGGQVIVAANYTKTLHQEMLQHCLEAKCEAYDMLFLIPHQMKPNGANDTADIRKIDIEKWKTAGIQLFDGTKESARRQYATDVNECRLYLYESCRGLEGWVTVCLNFDLLIENKFKEVKDQYFPQGLELESQEEAKRNFVYLWSMMPLTRPIDTLVITLHNPESEISEVIKKVADRYPDFVTYKL